MFTVAGAISEHYSWFHTLLRSRFTIGTVNGTVEALKLRCEMAFRSWSFETNQVYDATQDAGECMVEVTGAPGTRFQFKQL